MSRIKHQQTNNTSHIRQISVSVFQPSQTWKSLLNSWNTLPKFNSEFTPENGWLEDWQAFAFGKVTFQGRHVKLWGCSRKSMDLDSHYFSDTPTHVWSVSGNTCCLKPTVKPFNPSENCAMTICSRIKSKITMVHSEIEWALHPDLSYLTMSVNDQGK